MNPAEKFWASVDASGDCWEWTGGCDTQGYGRFYFSPGHYDLSHRHAWVVLVGPIPAGMQLDHLCRNRRCVNPDHLEPVTRRVNILRGYSPVAIRARQTECIRGHEFTPENTRIKNGYRNCRACHRADQFLRNRRNRAA